MTELLMLDIAPEVAELLGSADAIGKVFDTAVLGYRCTVCGDPGQLTAKEAAAVVLLLYDGGTAAPVVRLAHGCCSNSGIHVREDPLHIDADTGWPAAAWLRPHPDQPRAVLLIAPRATVIAVTAGGETADRLAGVLLGRGFALLVDLDAALPDVDRLAMHVAPAGRLVVVDRDDGHLWDGTVVLPPGWASAAATAGRVGVVLAAGLNLSDPTRDTLTDLVTAIGNGAVVGASTALLSEADRS